MTPVLTAEKEDNCCCFCGTTELLGKWYGNKVLDNIRETLEKKDKTICADCTKNIMQIMELNHKIKVE